MSGCDVKNEKEKDREAHLQVVQMADRGLDHTEGRAGGRTRASAEGLLQEPREGERVTEATRCWCSSEMAERGAGRGPPWAQLHLRSVHMQPHESAVGPEFCMQEKFTACPSNTRQRSPGNQGCR